MSKTSKTITVAADDLSAETRAILEAGDYVTDEALAEIRRVASPLEGREGWMLDEDGVSHYCRGRDEMSSYRIEVRDDDGRWIPAPGDASGWELAEARRAVANGVSGFGGELYSDGDVRIVDDETGEELS